MNETLDDIVAWIREIAQSWRQSNSYDKVTIGGLGVCDALEKIADRIEAATQREREAAGNSAELRKALGELRAELWNNTVISGKRKFKLYEIADAALAKPARNCDVYDKEEVRMAYHLHGDGLMTMQAVVDWLYSAKKKRGDESPRTEQKGKVRG